MGKRRRPSPKGNYQSISAIKRDNDRRMAGSALVISPRGELVVNNRDTSFDTGVKTTEMIKDLRFEQLLENAENFVENDRQSAMVQAMHPEINVDAIGLAGNRLGITDLAQALLAGKVPTQATADRIRSADYTDKQQLGIDGPFKPDSEIRVFNKLVQEADPTDGSMTYSLDKVGAPTEYLSKPEIDRQYQMYLRDLEDRYKPTQSNKGSFNSHAAEYYGQQALKAAGYRAPTDVERSVKQQRLNRNPKSSVLGTDRIIETNPKLSARELQGNPADFRFVSPKGNVFVADMQTGNTNEVSNVDFFKSMNMPTKNIEEFELNLGQYMPTEGTERLDRALQNMIKAGVLPQVQRGTVRGNQGIRAGKTLSNAPYMGKENMDQFRMDALLYGFSPQESRSSTYGMIPQELLLIQTNKLRDIIAQKMDYRIRHGADTAMFETNYGQDKLQAKVNLASIAKALKDKDKGLLTEEVMSQFRQPYSL